MRIRNIIKRIYLKLVRNKYTRRLLRVGAIPISWIVIIASGLFDRRWYALQHVDGRIVKFPLVHYLVLGRFRGLTPNILFTPEYFSPRSWSNLLLDPLAHYIIFKKNWKIPTHPLFDGAQVEYGRFMSPLSSFLSRVEANTKMPIDKQLIEALDEPIFWGDALAVLNKNNQSGFIKNQSVEKIFQKNHLTIKTKQYLSTIIQKVKLIFLIT